MEQQEFTALVRDGAAALEVGLGNSAAERLFCYFNVLLHWSQTVNLISSKAGEQEIVDRHFLDSLAVLRLLEPGRDRLLDVGSGAGFPGLVCKAGCPDLEVVLLEPRLKRVSFLRQVIRHCGFGMVPVLARRLEDAATESPAGPYSVIVGRAVADLAGFLKMCGASSAAGPGSRVVCMKGPRYGRELASARKQLVGWRLEAVDEYTLPGSGAARALLVFARSAETAVATVPERVG